MADYARVLGSLQARGLVYPCFCTRRDIALAGAAPQGDYGPLYPGTCRGLHSPDFTQLHVWRLNVALAHTAPLYWHDRGQGRIEAQPERLGDVVLARKDIPASYHLCVAHDDAVQGITLVTRGDDLREATHIHRLLQHLMDWPVPDYHFHPLVCDETGKRLAKRDNAVPLRELRQRGVTAREIREKYDAET
jgi:glutamyl-Q tRNA(Asp) synthetase